MIRGATLASSVAALLALAPATAWAEGPADATGSVRILSNDFPAPHAIVERAEACATDPLEVAANQTTAPADRQVAALTADPPEDSVKFGANGSLATLLTAGLLRPLDDLVAACGQDLQDSQLIRIDGKVMAVAFMAKAEHFFFREEVLAEAGVEPPQTWEDVAAAEAIRAKGIMEHPIGMAHRPGWALGQGLVNSYLGAGVELFEPASAMPAIAHEAGVQALEMMKPVAGYMDPDDLTFSSDALVPLLEASEVAMAVVWGSEASRCCPAPRSRPPSRPT